ncbi:MAG: hypothetical protein JWM89_1808 [Acidimicrobiales bacterium]|nr:hypothetical protein [Acidimicrobiales bacterium]
MNLRKDPNMNRTEAAELLGMKPDEVADVLDSPAGDVIVTRDGVKMIDVDEAHPDAEGKHGLMFLEAPTEKYSGLFPVYAAPPEGAEPPKRRRSRQAAPKNPPPASGAVGEPDADGRIIPANGDDPAAGPSAATAAHPDKVAAGEADTRPDPSVNTDDLDPGFHDPAAGGPAGAPQAVEPIAGDGPVGTAVIAEVPAGTPRQVLAWVGDDRGRAKAALAAERAADKPRAPLVEHLEQVAATPASDTPADPADPAV